MPTAFEREDRLGRAYAHAFDTFGAVALWSKRRREVRDAIDLCLVHEQVLPLGALAWAAADKDPGQSPEAIVHAVRARARYRQDEIDAERLITPVEARSLNATLRQIRIKAEG